MALHRGIQSAIFYYVSCAPCSDYRYRKRRKQEAQRDRADRELLESQMPDLYRHPSPSSTNPHWQAEIAMGPALSSRGKKKAHGGDSQRGHKASAPPSSNGSHMHSSVSLPRSVSGDDRHDSKWNFKPYQREDEELWGSVSAESPVSTHFDGSNGGETLARPPKARTKVWVPASTYRSFRNPAVSDLHPAIVTRVETREDVAWMLQPPPVAEVMSGKEPANRSRSDSGSSRPSASGSWPLSRQVSNRLLEKKLQAGDCSVPAGLTRGRSNRSTNSSSGRRQNGQAVNPTTAEQDFALSKRGRRRASTFQVSDSTESDVTVLRRSPLAPERARQQQLHQLSSRPQLSTIKSESSAPADIGTSYPLYEAGESRDENEQPARARHSSEDLRSPARDNSTARRSEGLAMDSTVRALQDLTLKPTVFNTQVLASKPAVADRDTKGRDLSRNNETERRMTAAPDLFSNWYMPDFELDTWVHEHTKREVRHRWSMDF